MSSLVYRQPLLDTIALPAALVLAFILLSILVGFEVIL